MRRPVRLKNDSTRLVIEGMGNGSGTTLAGFLSFFRKCNRHTKNSLESLHQPGAATAPPSAQLSSGPLGGPLGPQRVSQ